MKLNIKNMVCSRCLKVLRQELEQLGINVSSIELGVLVIDETAGNHNEIMEKIESVLHTNKFEIIHSSEEVLVEKIKHFLLRKIEELPLDSTVNLSQTLSAEFNHEYKSLSKLFSHLENTEKDVWSHCILRDLLCLDNKNKSRRRISNEPYVRAS